jgi:hypothetical protein
MKINCHTGPFTLYASENCTIHQRDLSNGKTL